MNIKCYFLVFYIFLLILMILNQWYRWFYISKIYFCLVTTLWQNMPQIFNIFIFKCLAVVNLNQLSGQRSDVFQLNVVLQGKLVHQRSDVILAKWYFSTFFKLLTSTELRVLQEINFPHQYPLFLIAKPPYIWYGDICINKSIAGKGLKNS